MDNNIIANNIPRLERVPLIRQDNRVQDMNIGEIDNMNIGENDLNEINNNNTDLNLLNQQEAMFNEQNAHFMGVGGRRSYRRKSRKYKHRKHGRKSRKQRRRIQKK